MSISLRNDIASRVINPQEFIEQAQKEAGEAVSLLEEKQTKTEKTVFKLNPDDSLDKKATTLLAGIDEFLKSSSEKGEPVKKTADQKNDSTKKLIQQKLGTPVKSAAAKVIESGIKDDAVRLELEKKAKEKNEGQIPVSIDFDALDIRALNEKVAISLTSLKKPVMVLAGGAGLIGAGYGAGSSKGKKNLKSYIIADRERDKAVTRKAFQVGQMSVINQIKNALAARGAAS